MSTSSLRYKSYTRNGLWPTSPGQDPLFTELAQMFDKCCEETPYGHNFCPVFEQCWRVWHMISGNGINNGIQRMGQKDFERYKAMFDKIKERKNGQEDSC